VHDVGEEVELIIYIVISASRNVIRARQSTQSPSMRLVGLEAGTLAANGSHMMDKRTHSRTFYHTAGSEHVLELENDGSTVSLWCSQVIGHVPPAGRCGGPLG